MRKIERRTYERSDGAHEEKRRKFGDKGKPLQ